MNQNHNRSKYFLFELMFNCLFFTIAAAICINLFIYGTVLSKQSRDISRASIEAQTLAEAFKSSNGDVYVLQDTVEGTLEQDTVYLYFDERWNRSEQLDEMGFVVAADISTNNDMSYADITVKSNQQEIFSLSVAKFSERGI